MKENRRDGPMANDDHADARYRATFAHAAIGIAHTHRDGKLIDANPAFCAMLGYARDEVLRLRLSDVLGAADAAAQPDPTGGLQHSRIEQYRHKDGTAVWGQRMVSVAAAPGGEPYLVHFVEDVTQKRRAAELQRLSDLRYQRTLESALDCIVTTDHGGRIIEFNPMAERVFRYARSEVLGKQLSEVLVPPRLRKRHEASMDRLLSDAQRSMLNRRIETIALRGDGTTIPVELMMQRITDTDPPLFTGFLRDISERKAAEARILRLNRLYRTLSQTSSLIVRAPDRTSLFSGVCRIAKHDGGFLTPWVGLIDQVTGIVRLEAHVEPEPFEIPVISAHAQNPGSDGPAGIAMRSAQIVICNDVAEGAASEDLSKPGRKAIRSLAALPLIMGGQVIGVFMLKSAVADYFDEDIRQLLQEMVAELAYALDRLQLEARHIEALNAVRESDERFRQLAENIPQMFWLTEPDLATALYVSPAFESLTGHRLDGSQQRHEKWLTCVHDDDRQTVLRARREQAHLGSYDIEYRITNQAGACRWVNDRAFPIRDPGGHVARIAGIVSDITEAREAQERLSNLAHYDQLTNLPNRVVFHDRLGHAIAQAARHHWTAGVMFIDLDRFKAVNDTMGHSMGDALLREVSQRLLECVRGEDLVSRLSGDEFAVVLARLTDANDAALVAAKILDRLKRPFEVEGVEVVVSASIGITLFPTDADNTEDLMRNADVAMYSAKARGRDHYRFYTAEMNARAVAKMKLESRLRVALDRREFVLHFQPKIAIATGAICGFEALIRWQPDDGAIVAPAEIVPILEETGLITAVGEWVVRGACAQIETWRAMGIKPVPIAINLSARQLRNPGFVEAVARMLAAHGVAAELLEVEITESSLMENPDEAERTLAQLKALGVQLAIDDFGTGYSSLGYLKRFPFDTLKIDRSFVRDIPADPDDATIARTIIALGHNLGLSVVAEGVETQEQLAFLRSNHCDYAQGFMFSAAVDGEAATRLLARAATFLTSGERLPQPARLRRK